MKDGQRPPLAKFDDIPGQLPHASVPANPDLGIIAQDVISKINDLRPESFTDDALWRDLLCFTGTYRTFYSRLKVYDTLRTLKEQKRSSKFELKGCSPRVFKVPGSDWIDVDLDFNTKQELLVAKSSGTASVVRGEDGEWRIWMLRTWLEHFDGQGSPDVLEPSDQKTCNTSLPNRDANGDEIYDVVIAGGGQAGLSTAGRLKALNLKYVLLERWPEIGDTWAKHRYDSSRWHTSKWSGALPFGQNFLDEDEYLVSAGRIGGAQKEWSKKYGINVRTGTNVETADWNETTKTWTVKATRVEEDLKPDNATQTFRAKYLVLALGSVSAVPFSPDWCRPERVKASGYKGTIMHATDYKSSKAWAGKRGIVVGTANTAHDVAEDMADVNMHTTMVQRNATFILPAAWLHASQDRDYTRDCNPDIVDKDITTYPNKISREIVNRSVHMGIKDNPEPLDALEKAGFKVDRYGDLYDNLLVRGGGHYVDVGASRRIANGEIKIKGDGVRGLTENGMLFDDGSEIEADLIVVCTGFKTVFREIAEGILGDTADQMDDYWGVDAEGELRGHAKRAGHPRLFYHGGDTRAARFFARFIALQVQADLLGEPLDMYLD